MTPISMPFTERVLGLRFDKPFWRAEIECGMKVVVDSEKICSRTHEAIEHFTEFTRFDAAENGMRYEAPGTPHGALILAVQTLVRAGNPAHPLVVELSHKPLLVVLTPEKVGEPLGMYVLVAMQTSANDIEVARYIARPNSRAMQLWGVRTKNRVEHTPVVPTIDDSLSFGMFIGGFLAQSGAILAARHDNRNFLSEIRDLNSKVLPTGDAIAFGEGAIGPKTSNFRLGDVLYVSDKKDSG